MNRKRTDLNSNRHLSLLLLILFFLSFGGFKLQAEEKEKFSLTFSGYIKTDVIFDTRQTVSLREGHFLLYPQDRLLDPAGHDLNAKDTFHILPIQTRLALKINGPPALGAKTSGYIEAEFFGMSDTDINGFRLRHAYLKLNWDKTEVLVGQFWHPMFISESYPEVVSFNTGAPFEPFSRAPQIRFTWLPGDLSFSLTALAQRDFASTGPAGVSTSYFRNAACPELDFKAAWSRKNFLDGAGINVLKIVPRLATETGYEANESLTSLAGYAFGRLKTRPVTIKAEGVYGGNLHHLTMLGGYAVSEIIDPVTAQRDYSPINTAAGWIDIQTNGEKWQVGLFSGYTKNLGAKDEISGPIYSRVETMDHLVRIAPRFVFNAGKIRLAQEIELTSAAYGAVASRGRVNGLRTVTNLRLLAAVYYFF
ncbi:MAG: hypothetical protein GYA53_03770 [Acidobacteria bacterium]|nr:hypothetical protein [Acidobacteriota bacterium]